MWSKFLLLGLFGAKVDPAAFEGSEVEGNGSAPTVNPLTKSSRSSSKVRSNLLPRHSPPPKADPLEREKLYYLSGGFVLAVGVMFRTGIVASALDKDRLQRKRLREEARRNSNDEASGSFGISYGGPYSVCGYACQKNWLSALVVSLPHTVVGTSLLSVGTYLRGTRDAERNYGTPAELPSLRRARKINTLAWMGVGLGLVTFATTYGPCLEKPVCRETVWWMSMGAVVSGTMLGSWSVGYLRHHDRIRRHVDPPPVFRLSVIPRARGRGLFVAGRGHF